MAHVAAPFFHKGQAQLEWHLLDPREDGEEKAEVSNGAARPMDISAAGHIGAVPRFRRGDSGAPSSAR